MHSSKHDIGVPEEVWWCTRGSLWSCEVFCDVCNGGIKWL